MDKIMDGEPCSAINCFNRVNQSDNKTFHRFPLREKKILNAWVEKACKKRLLPSTRSLLCSDHFDSSCFIKSGSKKILKKDAIPTISYEVLDEDNAKKFPHLKLKVKAVSCKNPPSTLKSTDDPQDSHDISNHKVSSELLEPIVEIEEDILSEFVSHKKPKYDKKFFGETKCIAKDCSNNLITAGGNVLLFPVPKQMDIYLSWLEAVDRLDLLEILFDDDVVLCICSNHFSDSMFMDSKEKIKGLQKEAMPSLQCHSSLQTHTEDPYEELLKLKAKNKILKQIVRSHARDQLKKRVAEEKRDNFKDNSHNISLSSDRNQVNRKTAEATSDSTFNKQKNFDIRKLQEKNDEYKKKVHKYILRERKLTKDIEELKKLKNTKNDEELRKILLNFANKHFNHILVAWLEGQLMSDEDRQNDKWPSPYKVFSVSIFNISRNVYKLCQTVFGLPPIRLVEEWSRSSVTEMENIRSTINSIFEESTPIKWEKEIINEGTNIEATIEFKDPEMNVSHILPPDFPLKEEGKASSEMEIITFSDSESEEDTNNAPITTILQEQTEGEPSSYFIQTLLI